MLDKDFINRKIRLIAEDMGRIEELKDYTLDELAKDFYKLNTAERLLEKLVIRATDINNHLIAELGKGIEKVRSYRDSFLRLADFGIYPQDFAERIGESARFRNILVHDYNNIDKNLIHKKIGEVFDDFNKYSNYILKFIETK